MFISNWSRYELPLRSFSGLSENGMVINRDKMKSYDLGTSSLDSFQNHFMLTI